MKQPSRGARFLERVQILGDKLPDLNIIFLISFIIMLLLSAILSQIDFELFNPLNNEKVVVKNLLAPEQIVLLITKMSANFMAFPALSIVLISALGVGIAEGSGLLRALCLRACGLISRRFVSPAVIFISICSHMISVSAYVFLMPIAALMYRAAGRHPVAGIATAFAALAGGFSANYIPTVVDPIMQLFAQKAARSIDTAYEVHVLANYFIGFAQTFAVIIACWFISARIIEPMCERLMPLNQLASDEAAQILPNSDPKRERVAFFAAIACFFVLLAVLFIFCLPASSPARGTDSSLLAANSLLMAGIVPLVFLFLALCGFVYGALAGNIKSGADLSQMMAKALHPLAGFVVFCFICAQFLYAFEGSNISSLIAIGGAKMLSNVHSGGIISLFGFILISSFLNIFVPSATSKWAILSAVFVPMLMLLGISPELTQAAYRAADSASNVITPLFPFYPLVLSYIQRYMPEAKIGTLSALMLPYGVGLWLALVGTLVIFWSLEIPLGFGGAKY